MRRPSGEKYASPALRKRSGKVSWRAPRTPGSAGAAGAEGGVCPVLADWIVVGVAVGVAVALAVRNGAGAAVARSEAARRAVMGRIV